MITIDEKLVNELLKDYQKPEDLLGENGILKQLTKSIVERALAAEMTHHLGYGKHTVEGHNSGNSRNGSSGKTLKTEQGDITVSIPRDRNSSFEPQLIKKGQRRFEGFDDKIISMYSLGMSTRDIQAHLKEIYGTDVSADLVSTVTDAVVKEVQEWQHRPLDRIYPIVYLDAMFVKSRDEGHVRNKAVYLAIGVTVDGLKDVLGMWIEQTEGAKFWLKVLTELKNRGLEDILIACVDGLKGFPEAIEAVFPATEIQACIVHMVRGSLKFVTWKRRKEVAGDLKAIYTSSTQEEAAHQLDLFAEKWDKEYPTISQSWRRNWDRIIPFLAYPQEIRKAIYTTNAIESLNRSLKKVIKTKGAFPNDEAVFKLLYLAIRNASKRWTMPIREWGQAINQLAIAFPGRIQI